MTPTVALEPRAVVQECTFCGNVLRVMYNIDWGNAKFAMYNTQVVHNAYAQESYIQCTLNKTVSSLAELPHLLSCLILE